MSVDWEKERGPLLVLDEATSTLGLDRKFML